jgi:hypothetical protein
LCSVNALLIYCEWYFRGSSPKLGSFRDTQEFHYYSFCSFHFSATPFKTEFWFISIDSKYVESFQAVNFLLVNTGYETVNRVLIYIMQSVTDISFWIIFHVYSVQKLVQYAWDWCTFTRKSLDCWFWAETMIGWIFFNHSWGSLIHEYSV